MSDIAKNLSESEDEKHFPDWHVPAKSKNAEEVPDSPDSQPEEGADEPMANAR